MPRWLDELLPWALIGALTLATWGAAYGALWLLKGLGGVFEHAWNVLVKLPPSFAKTMSVLTVVLVLAAGLATPLAWWETRSARRYARMEEDLRRERAEDEVMPYSGIEGEGVLFESPNGERILLLQPAAGVGAPRVIHKAARPLETQGEPAS